MALETFTGIWSLNTANPVGGVDPKSAGDDHIRGIKYTLRYTWPNVVGVVSASDGELNMLVGVTSGVQAQLDGKAPKINPVITGTLTAGIANFSGAVTFSVSPTAPTAALGDSSTKLATTAFVATTAFSSSLPAMSAGTANKTITNNGSAGSWTPRQGHYLYLFENYT
jgi:hypothetical protein